MVSHLGSIDDQSIFEVANGIKYQGIFEAISTLDCSDDSCDYLHSYLHRDDDVVSGTQRDKEYVSVYTLHTASHRSRATGPKSDGTNKRDT